MSVYPYGSRHPLKIVGVAAINVQAFGQQRTLDFMVSMEQGAALLGRESATDLDLLRVGPPPPNASSLNVVGQHHVNTNPPKLLDVPKSNTASPPTKGVDHLLPEHLKTTNILSRYNKVFEGLGRVKNVQIEKMSFRWCIPPLGSQSIAKPSTKS